MRNRGPAAALALAVATAACGCAPAGTGAGREAIDARSRSHTRTMGELAYGALAGALEPVLVELHGYALRRREEQYSSLYYETSWRRREPFPDEAERGVVGARSRIILRGIRSGGAGYRVTFEGENRVRTRADTAWHAMAVTPDFVAYMNRIREDLLEAAGAAGASRALSAPAQRDAGREVQVVLVLAPGR